MTKEELKPLEGKYIELTFTLYNKKHKVTTYFQLMGHLLEVENKNVLFKCNYNHEFIVSIARIKNATLQGERRTQEEGMNLIIKKQQQEIEKLKLMNQTNPNFL